MPYLPPENMKLFWFVIMVNLQSVVQTQLTDFAALPSPLSPPVSSFTPVSHYSGTDQQMSTVPADGLHLASGDTAVLQCQLSTLSYKSFSWTDTSTNFSLTASNITEYQDAVLTLQNETDHNESILTLSLSNLKSPDEKIYRCDSEGEVDGQPWTLQKTVKLSIISSERLCTVEHERETNWNTGKMWRRHQSFEEADDIESPSKCDDSFADHTYGKGNTIGHYIKASSSEQTAAEESRIIVAVMAHSEPKCLHFFYRYCIWNDSDGSLSVMIMKNKQSNAMILSSEIREWKDYILPLPSQPENYQIIISVTFKNTNETSYVALDDMSIDDEECVSEGQFKPEISANDQSDPKSSTSSTSREMLSASVQYSGSSSSTVMSSSSTTTTTTTVSSSSGSRDYTNYVRTDPTIRNDSSVVSLLTPSVSSTGTTPSASVSLESSTTPAIVKSSSSSDIMLSIMSTTTTKTITTTPNATVIPDAEDDSNHQTDDESSDEEIAGDNSTGLAIGIILAIMVAGACTAAILYRRRKNGKKSTYITFGNPSYSREHLPVNDFGLDSPLTLSSNGYTVLA